MLGRSLLVGRLYYDEWAGSMLPVGLSPTYALALVGAVGAVPNCISKFAC